MSTIAVFGGTGETGKEVVFQVSYCCPFSLLRVTYRSVVEQKYLGAIGEICLCGNVKIRHMQQALKQGQKVVVLARSPDKMRCVRRLSGFMPGRVLC